jgi:hypothetical protein
MTYSNEIIEDVKHFHGTRFVTKNEVSKDTINSIQSAIALHNAMTQEERDSILIIKDNYEMLEALKNRVKERMSK